MHATPLYSFEDLADGDCPGWASERIPAPTTTFSRQQTVACQFLENLGEERSGETLCLGDLGKRHTRTPRPRGQEG